MVDSHVLGGLSDADIGGNPISKLDKDDISNDEVLGVALGLLAVLVDDGLGGNWFEGREGNQISATTIYIFQFLPLYLLCFLARRTHVGKLGHEVAGLGILKVGKDSRDGDD